ncbi:unnamed protein product [Ceutorhynchus assimilis]|uniref:Uncharacterized protein n=1 Tax=Ceutorhynchus assimilis TaxID=467358 RepID=A0A9N9MWQ9_9CUCU|nr:unnamed protein product [Ceutorhynchus assimilis]
MWKLQDFDPFVQILDSPQLGNSQHEAQEFFAAQSSNNCHIHRPTSNLRNIDETVSCYYQNAGGLRSKNHQLSTNSVASNLDIIVITETWLNEGFSDAELSSSEYMVFRLCNLQEEEPYS